MRLTNLLRVSLKAVLANKTRSILTSLGIIIGVASVIMLVSIGTGIRAYVTSAFEDLGTNLLMVMPGKFSFSDSREGGPPGVATNKLTLDLARKIERVDGVVSVLPIVSSNNDARFRGESVNTFIVGATESYPTVRNSPMGQGRFFRRSEVNRAARVAVLGTTVVEEIFGKLNPLGQDITIGDKRYQVIGVLTSKGAGFGSDQDNQILVPITALQRDADLDKLSYVYVQSASTEQIAEVTKGIEETLGRELDDDEFSVVNSAELLSTITGILGALTLALGGIAAISLLVGGIGIMNIMLVSVTERTREIGLRKAVGAKPSDILIQFLIEAVVLSLLGGIIGIILGTLGSLAISRFIQTSVTFWSVAAAFGFSVAVGVIFGVWPSWKAGRLSPIDALRYE